MLCQKSCSTVVWFPVSKSTVEKPLPFNFWGCFPETLDYIGLLVTLRLFTQVQNNGHCKHCPNMSAFSSQMFDVPGWTEWQLSCNNFYFLMCKKMKYVSWRTRIRNSDMHILYFWTCILGHLLFSITICLLLFAAWNGSPLRRQSSGTLLLALSQIYQCMITPQHWLPHIYLTGWMPAGCGLWLCLYSGLLCIRCVHWENIIDHIPIECWQP